MFNSEAILHQLEEIIPEASVPDLMPGDKWLISSSMQKAIRRGETERALRAAASLWHLDRQNFWRRIHTAAMEDCSADADVVVSVLIATANSTWRRRMGDLRVALFLTRMLCETVKSRAADELFLLLERSSKHKDLWQQYANADDARLRRCVIDATRPLVERSICLWLTAGTTKAFPSDLVPQRTGSPDEAKDSLRSLNAPPALVEACIAVMSRTQWPLSIFTPLIWQEVQKQGSSLQVLHNTIPATPDVDGVPLYGCDMFTRIGQTCFRRLRSAVPALKPYPQYHDAVHIASELGRLDFITVLLAAIAIILALGGIFAFLSIRRNARDVAKDTAESVAEMAANKYIQEKLPEILESYREFIRNAVTEEVGNNIAGAQDDNGNA